MALPHVMKRAEEKMRENARRYQSNQQPPRNEGEVTIEKPQHGKKGNSGGDYVDYVEIKD